MVSKSAFASALMICVPALMISCKLGANSSKVASSSGPCDASIFAADGCEQQTVDRSRRINLNFGVNALQKSGAIQDNRLMLGPGETIIANIPFTNPVYHADILTTLNVEYKEVQVRRQEWKNCGFLNAERCRHWVDRDRGVVRVQLFIEANGTRYFSPTYDTSTLPATDWSENSDLLRTMFGPIASMMDGKILDSFRDMMNGLIPGRDLHTGWRTFTGAVDSPINTSIPPNATGGSIKVGAIVSGAGLAKLAPFSLTIQTFNE
ncbi:MAG: hypothetical protein FJ146_08740 [Deltaproteobacteria bacterium]|nr:hypothetical protein [Deltaproteobacteria bacterium]